MPAPVFIVAPTPDLLSRTASRLGVPLALLQHALDADELPRMERDSSAVLVLLRVPAVSDEKDGPPFVTVPLGVLDVPGHAPVLLVRRPCRVVERLQALPGLEDVRASTLLLRTVLITAEVFLSMLAELNRTLDKLEDGVGRALGNAEVLALLSQQKSLVFFNTALRLNELMLERLRKDAWLDASSGDHDLVEDALVELRQAAEVTRINSDILANMMDAFASIISNNLNVVMKVLTVLTVLGMLPTMVASFYGMNVVLPGSGSPWAFTALFSGSMLASALVAVALRRRGWF